MHNLAVLSAKVETMSGATLPKKGSPTLGSYTLVVAMIPSGDWDARGQRGPSREDQATNLGLMSAPSVKLRDCHMCQTEGRPAQGFELVLIPATHRTTHSPHSSPIRPQQDLRLRLSGSVSSWSTEVGGRWA